MYCLLILALLLYDDNSSESIFCALIIKGKSNNSVLTNLITSYFFAKIQITYKRKAEDLKMLII